MRKKILTSAIALGLIFSLSTTIFADPISDQIKQQQDVIDQNKSKVNDVNNESKPIESRIEILDEGISAANEKITSNKIKITNAKVQIVKAEKDIVEAQAQMDAEQELFSGRMRALYIRRKAGANAYVSVLLEAKGMSDFLSRVETVKNLAALDKKISAEIKSKQNIVKNKKSNLDADKVKLEKLVSDNIAKLDKLKKDREVLLVLISKAKVEAGKYTAIIGSANDSIKKIRESVPKMSVSRGATAISSNSIVAYASNFIGTPYVYGANGPTSFDCSGFTKYVFAHFGVGLNRVAGDQASQGSSISQGNLAPGDLVFFGGSMSSVNHVGIYVGNGCYIHSPHTGDSVKISPMGQNNFVGAKRVN